ncbi:MAG: SCP2 sterol-binding domain-containing protein [Lachnospiraceae bacterium]|nr:SCP2 sterol-binding domain-containing protein [Lachnospiraceae bacterium]
MKYEELVDIVKKATGKRIVSKLLGHVAYQFNVEGEAEGAFYLEVDEGKINVEPYEYYDRDLIIVTSAAVIIQMVEGKLEPMEAYTNGLLKAYGDEDYLKILPLGKHKNKE